LTWLKHRKLGRADRSWFERTILTLDARKKGDAGGDSAA